MTQTDFRSIFTKETIVRVSRKLEGEIFMKIRGTTFILALCLFCTSLTAGSVENAVSGMLKELTGEYKKNNPDLDFKAGVAVLKVSSDSSLAKKYDVGNAVRGLTENQLSKSLVFDLISRENVDKMIKEIEFGMTGLVETSKLQAGKMREAEYFVDGSVTEIGSDFKVVLRLIKVETATVIATAERSLPKTEIVSAAEDYSLSYVAKYGIGIELSLSPLFTYILSNPQLGRKTANEFVVLNTAINYRVNRNFVWWMGMGVHGGTPEFDYNNFIIPRAELANVSIPSNWKYLEYGYYRMRNAATPKIGAAYVLPINTRFNISLGGSFQMPFMFEVQLHEIDYSETNAINSDVINNKKVYKIPSWNMAFIVAPQIKAQYFLSPRLSMQFSYTFLYQLPVHIMNWDYVVNSRVYGQKSGGSDSGGIPELYDLKPWLDPRGRKLSHDLSGHLFEIGIGLYF